MRISSYTYDGFNQVRETTDPLGGITTFAYDKNGNLRSVEDARQQLTNHKVTSYTYDELNRLKTRTDQPGRPPEVFAYDPSGNLKSYIYRRGKIADFMYDALDRRICAGFGRVGSDSNCTGTWGLAAYLRRDDPSRSSSDVYSFDTAQWPLSGRRSLHALATAADRVVPCGRSQRYETSARVRRKGRSRPRQSSPASPG